MSYMNITPIHDTQAQTITIYSPSHAWHVQMHEEQHMPPSRLWTLNKKPWGNGMLHLLKACLVLCTFSFPLALIHSLWASSAMHGLYPTYYTRVVYMCMCLCVYACQCVDMYCTCVYGLCVCVCMSDAVLRCLLSRFIPSGLCALFTPGPIRAAVQWNVC